jgi:hypothetical protein
VYSTKIRTLAVATENTPTGLPKKNMDLPFPAFVTSAKAADTIFSKQMTSKRIRFGTKLSIAIDAIQHPGIIIDHFVRPYRHRTSNMSTAFAFAFSVEHMNRLRITTFLVPVD